jgi:hypothetical protein
VVRTRFFKIGGTDPKREDRDGERMLEIVKRTSSAETTS